MALKYLMFITERVANGETKIMTSQPPKELASTSGTTGNTKLLLIEKDRNRSIEKSYLPLLNEIRAIYPQVTTHMQKKQHFYRNFFLNFYIESKIWIS